MDGAHVTMRIRVDHTVCAGAGLCQSMSPKLFRVTDAGHAVALKSDLDDAEEITAAQDVIDCCPTEAVSSVPVGPDDEVSTPR